MFLGHIPAGYLVSYSIIQLRKDPNLSAHNTNKLLFIGLIAAVFPDIDLFYFYFIDNRQHLHHSYWTHIPFYWVIMGSLLLSIEYWLKNKKMIVVNYLISINLLVHFFLDTIVGKIKWLYPFSNEDIVCFHVPANYGWWVLNFVLHWTFLFELILLFLAIFIILKNRRGKSI
jgi:inner membrane protein